MAKKKKATKAPAVSDAKPKDEEELSIDDATKAEGFDQIVEKNKEVRKMKLAYLQAKDRSLGKKKSYDEANGQLSQLIEKLSTPLPLFEGEPEDHKAETEEEEEEESPI